jgi:VIT1/CCC1 family predicted Fe2+/Mn2+ transporter
MAPFEHVSIAVVAVSVVTLAILGAFGARTGRAPVARAVIRVVLLGVAAMLLTISLGRIFGTTI